MVKISTGLIYIIVESAKNQNKLSRHDDRDVCKNIKSADATDASSLSSARMTSPTATMTSLIFETIKNRYKTENMVTNNNNDQFMNEESLTNLLRDINKSVGSETTGKKVSV